MKAGAAARSKICSRAVVPSMPWNPGAGMGGTLAGTEATWAAGTRPAGE